MTDSTYIHGTDASEQERLSALNRATNARFVAFLQPQGTRRILEVGSGLGLLARDVAQAAPAAHVTGIEYSAEQLARAPRDVQNLELRQGDAHELPFADGSFDLVYSRYVLEHLRDPVRALSEMRRVLVPGGRLALQENDISLTRVDPPVPAFDAVWRAFAERQARLGGDPCIGSRLYRLVIGADFEGVVLSTDPEVHWYGSPGFDPWMRNLESLLRGAREQLVRDRLASPELAQAAADELSRVRADRGGSAIFHWNRATARKRAS